MSHFRRKNPLAEADELSSPQAPVSAAQPTVIDQLSAEEIKACTDELPEGYRTVFNLRAVEEYDYAEIADLLGISEATVRSQYQRARMRLIEIMQRRLHARSGD